MTKAPDKIYVGETDHAGMYKELYAAYGPTKDCREYISKDALLEWATYMRDENKKFADNASGDYARSRKNDVHTFQLVIDKLNSM